MNILGFVSEANSNELDASGVRIVDCGRQVASSFNEDSDPG